MEEKKYAETRLGLFGGLLPMIVMVASIILMSAFGLSGVSYLSAAGFLALVAGWLVYKDSRMFQTAVTKGLASPTLCGIIPIYCSLCPWQSSVGLATWLGAFVLVY